MNSRAKGCAGEREACEALAEVLGFPWRRTAQRWGKAKADIEPAQPVDFPVHVEVKRRKDGLKWWLGRLGKAPFSTHLDDHGQLYFCLLYSLHRAVAQDGHYLLAPHQAKPVGWMRQAINDADEGMIPVVLLRQDRGPWILAWRCQDDDRLMALLRKVMPCDA
jgi:hypothetical protein